MEGKILMALKLTMQFLREVPQKVTLLSVILAALPPLLDDYQKFYFDDMSWFLLFYPCFLFSYYLGFNGGLYAAIMVNIYHLFWLYLGKYTHNGEILDGSLALHFSVVIVTFSCSIMNGILSERLKNQQKKLEGMNEQLKHIALYDSLTGLPNRAYFMEKLNVTLDAQKPVTFMFLDLDGFKRVNDSFGHKEGDRLLKMAGERLKLISDDFTFVSRLGGDEFVVLMKGDDHTNVSKMANDILSSLQIQIHEVSISASIGIAFFQKGDTPSSLLNRADMAMYQSKLSGKNSIFVSAM